MRESDDIAAWRVGVGRNSGASLPGKVKVYSPGCAASPHAERGCRCRTFGTRTHANAYIAEQTAIDKGDS